MGCEEGRKEMKCLIKTWYITRNWIYFFINFTKFREGGAEGVWLHNGYW